MAKVLLVGNTKFCLFNFRKELMEAMSEREDISFDVAYPMHHDAFSNYDTSIVPDRIFNFSMSRHGKNPLKELRSLFQLGRIVRMSEPKVIYSYTIKPNISVAVLKVLFKFKSVATITGMGRFRGLLVSNTIIRLIYFRLLSLHDVIVVQNVDDYALFKDHIPKQDVQLVHGSGVNLDSTKALINYTTPKEPLKLSFLGRIIEGKGAHLLCEAVSALASEGHNVALTIIGDFDGNNKTYERYVRDVMERTDSIHFMGFKSNPLEILKEMDVVCLPSKYAEGTPRSLIEALALGKIVATTDTPGCRDVVSEELHNGVIIKEWSVQGVKNCILYLVSLSPNELSLMKRASRQLAENQFSVETLTKKYLGYIDV